MVWAEGDTEGLARHGAPEHCWDSTDAVVLNFRDVRGRQ